MSPAELLTLLVGTPSVSGEEGPLADLVQDLLAKKGFEVQRLGHNLWFTLGKKGGSRLLLNSHLDTVPPCAGWEGDPVGHLDFPIGADRYGDVAAGGVEGRSA